MVPWIQVYSNILTHDKTYALAEALKIPNYAAAGLMVSLWAWVAVNAVDGDITTYPPRAIADAVGWRKNPDSFFQTLRDIRLIEEKDGRTFIRNWEKYAALLIKFEEEQKQKTRERVARHRAKKNQNSDDITCNVTNALPICDVTLLLNQTEQDHDSCDGDDDARTCVQENVSVMALVNEMYARYFERAPTQHEQNEVLRLMRWVYISSENQKPKITPTDDEKALLQYAFEQAANANQKSIAYLHGIYHNFRMRKIKTEEDLVNYDFERDQKRFSS